MYEIVAVRKGPGGSITDVQLNDGQQITVDTAIAMSKAGTLKDTVVGGARDGSETLRSPRDREDQPGQFKNLSDMPTF